MRFPKEEQREQEQARRFCTGLRQVPKKVHRPFSNESQVQALWKAFEDGYALNADMLEAGWIEEVRTLLEEGVTVEMTPMLAVGYREIVQHLRGELGMEELRERILTSSARFAKHQGTWFNREPSIQWMEPGPDLVERVLPIARSAFQNLHTPGKQGN